MEDELYHALGQALVDTVTERQKKPHQFVVVYKKKTEEIIGYHLSSFCQITDDILRGKRYNGLEPDKQLAIIWGNICGVLKKTKEESEMEGLQGVFNRIAYDIKMEHFNGLTEDDIYIDALYLVDGTPPQEITAVLIKPS